MYSKCLPQCFTCYRSSGAILEIWDGASTWLLVSTSFPPAPKLYTQPIGNVQTSLCTSVPGHPVAPLLAELFLRCWPLAEEGAKERSPVCLGTFFLTFPLQSRLLWAAHLLKWKSCVLTLIGFQERLIFACVTAARNPALSLSPWGSPDEFCFRYHTVHPPHFLEGCV